MSVGVTRFAALLAAALAGGPSAGAEPAAPLGERFEQVFDARGEPPWLHYRAEYRGREGGTHRLEVWRDHDARIRRLTDDRLDIVATRGPARPLSADPPGGEGDIRFTVSDRQGQAATTIDRVNLMRLGLFVDWYAQGHGLRQPAGAYRLARLPEEAAPPPLERRCALWRLSPAPPAGATDICWDETLKLPLWMRDAEGRIVWRVLAHDLQPIADAVFAAGEGAAPSIDLNPEFGPAAD